MGWLGGPFKKCVVVPDAVDEFGVGSQRCSKPFGVAGEQELATELEVAAADNLKRVRRAPVAEPDWTASPSLDTMTDFVEIKTVWHPMGV